MTHYHSMKTTLISASVLAAGFLTLSASAQVATPSTPAPAVVTEPAPAVAPNRIIYAPTLPSAIELTKVAAAQGNSVERIDQTSDRIIVTYKSADGQLSTISYQLLPNAASAASATTTATVVVPSQAPRVVYTSTYAPSYPYYVYDNSPYYYPWGFYSPVSLSIGLGYGFRGGYGFHGGYYRGWRHGRW